MRPQEGIFVSPVQNQPQTGGGLMLRSTRDVIQASSRSDVAPFMVMDVMAAAARLEAEGRHIIHLEVGQPAASAPEPALAAARQALKEARIAYTEALGLPSLRRRIADFYQHRYRLAVDPGRVI